MLSDNLKRYRELCDFTQQQVADCLQIHRSTYTCYETGKTKPSPDTLMILSRLFNVPLSVLYGMDDDIGHGPETVRDVPLMSVEDELLDDRIGTRVGDLEREEKELILYYRMLTSTQRRELLSALQGRQDGRNDKNEKK